VYVKTLRFAYGNAVLLFFEELSFEKKNTQENRTGMYAF
jgi:hypothetical protein